MYTRITKYTSRKYIKVWMRMRTHTEIEHVCTDDCEFPREKVCPLSPAALAGKGKTKELVILSVLGFSRAAIFCGSRVLCDRLTWIATRAYTPRVFPRHSLFRFCARVCEVGGGGRERKEEGTAVYRIHSTDERIFNERLLYVFKDISRISIIKRPLYGDKL